MLALLKLGQIVNLSNRALAVLPECISKLRNLIVSITIRSGDFRSPGLSCTESPNTTQIPLYL